jgi:hypothetical protein
MAESGVSTGDVALPDTAGTRQVHEDPDAMLERAESVAKREHPLGLAAGCRRRIRHAPVRGHGPARPHRADLVCRVVADRDDEIELHCARRRKFIPALAARFGRGDLQVREQLERERVDASARETARAVRAEPALAPMVQQRLGEDAPRRVAGAQEEDIEESRLRLRHAGTPQRAQQPPVPQAVSDFDDAGP